MDKRGPSAPGKFQLRTFGAIDLIDANGSEVRALLAQSKRLALLVYLVLAPPPNFRRRDTVVALFWPDLDDEHARGALRQALSYLRQSLGADAVVSRGTDDIGVSRDLVECDAERFESAMASGDAEAALALYTGQFLDGLHASADAQELDEWIAGERSRLHAMALAGARSLAEGARRAGNAVEEERWVRRAYALAGRDELELSQLLRLLDRKGDRVGALRLYDDFARRIKQDMDAAPSPETQAVALAIRARTAAPPRAELALASDPPHRVGTERAAGASPIPPATATASRRARYVGWVGTGIGALLVFALATAVMAWRATAALDPRRVAIARFVNKTGDLALDPLGELTADRLERGLAETHLLAVVDARDVARAMAGPPAIARARSLTAGTVIWGSYYRHADSLIIEAQVVDARTGNLIQSVGSGEGPVSAPQAAIAVITDHAMAAFSARFDPHYSEYEGSSQPTSYEASQEFLAGDEFRRREGAGCNGDCYEAELRHYERAYALDSNFTLPLARAAFASWMTRDCARTDTVATRLRPRHDRLAILDRLTLDAVVAACHGERTHALELARASVVVNPQSDAARIWLSYLARKSGRFRESLALMDSLDTTRSRTHRVYWGNVTISSHLLGEHHRELELESIRRRLGVRPNSVEGISFEARALVALGRIPEMRERLDEMLRVPTNVVQERIAAVWLDEVGGDLEAHGYPEEARAVYRRAADWCRARPPAELRDNEDDCARALYHVGEFAAARKVFAQFAKEDPTNVDWQANLGVIAARTGDEREAARVDQWLAAQHGPYLAGEATFARARMAAVRGDRERAVTLLRLAIDEGATVFGGGFGLHSDPDFLPLRGYAPYDELLRPKE